MIRCAALKISLGDRAALLACAAFPPLHSSLIAAARLNLQSTIWLIFFKPPHTPPPYPFLGLPSLSFISYTLFYTTPAPSFLLDSHTCLIFTNPSSLSISPSTPQPSFLKAYSQAPLTRS